MSLITTPGDPGYIEPGSEEYLNHLGASEAAAILVPDGFKDQTEVWMEKTRRKKPQGHKMIFDRGHDMEPLIMKKLKKDHGRAVTGEQTQYRDPERPWLVCHVDGMCGASSRFDGPGIVEVKAPGSNMARVMSETGMTNQYTAQVQMGTHIAAAAIGDPVGWALCAFLNYDDYEVVPFDVPAAAAYQANALQVLDHFWDCVQKDTPPSPVNPSDLGPLPEVNGEMVYLDDERTTELARMFIDADKEKAFAVNQDKSIRETIKTLCGDNGLVELSSMVRISYKYQKGRTSINGAGLLDYCEHLVEELNELLPAGDRIVFDRNLWMKVGAPFRSFRPTVINK